MSNRPLLPALELDALFDDLRVEPIAFSECLVGAGWSMAFAPTISTGLHHVFRGAGRLVSDDGRAVEFASGALLVTPPGKTYRIEPVGRNRGKVRVATVKLPNLTDGNRGLDRYVAGPEPAEIAIICGHFHARHAMAFDLFAAIEAPVVQPFADDTVGVLLSLIRLELADQRLGTRTMADALFRQLLVLLFRQAIAAGAAWVESVPTLRDAQILRAFHAMVSRLGDPHSVSSLAEIACLSRSAFVKRFTAAFGHPPVRVLRELRLLRAAERLRAGMAVDQVSRAMGYDSPSGFSRAFRARFGADPSRFAALR